MTDQATQAPGSPESAALLTRKETRPSSKTDSLAARKKCAALTQALGSVASPAWAKSAALDPALDGLHEQGRAQAGAAVRIARPALRPGSPALRGPEVAPDNSLHSLRSLCSNTSGGLDDEARECTRRPQGLCCSASQTHRRARLGPALRPAVGIVEWAAPIILAGGAINMMAGGEESTAG